MKEKEKPFQPTTSEREKIVRLLREKPLFKNSDVREVLSVERRHAEKIVYALVDEGYLVRDHATKQAAFFRKNK